MPASLTWWASTRFCGPSRRPVRSRRRGSLLSGLLARDLLLKQIYGDAVPPATRDVDVAVVVGGWPEYKALRRQLTGKHGVADEPDEQRLRSPAGTPSTLCRSVGWRRREVRPVSRRREALSLRCWGLRGPAGRPSRSDSARPLLSR